MSDDIDNIKICPSCGDIVEDENVSVCPTCGSPLDSIDDIIDQETIICSKCGKETSLAENICKHCGEELALEDILDDALIVLEEQDKPAEATKAEAVAEEVIEEFVCPKCEGVVSNEDLVCPHCGESFVEFEEVSEQAIITPEKEWMPLSSKDKKKAKKKLKKEKGKLEKSLKKGDITKEDMEQRIQRLKTELGLEPPTETVYEEFPPEDIAFAGEVTVLEEPPIEAMEDLLEEEKHGPAFEAETKEDEVILDSIVYKENDDFLEEDEGEIPEEVDALGGLEELEDETAPPDDMGEDMLAELDDLEGDIQFEDDGESAVFLEGTEQALDTEESEITMEELEKREKKIIEKEEALPVFGEEDSIEDEAPEEKRVMEDDGTLPWISEEDKEGTLEEEDLKDPGLGIHGMEQEDVWDTGLAEESEELELDSLDSLDSDIVSDSPGLAIGVDLDRREYDDVLCPYCQTLLEPGSERCFVCGYDLTSQAADIITCPNCYEALPAGSTSCPICNTSIDLKEDIQIGESDEEVYCTLCGAVFPEYAETCPVCGSEFGAEAESAPIVGEMAGAMESRYVCPECGSDITGIDETERERKERGWFRNGVLMMFSGVFLNSFSQWLSGVTQESFNQGGTPAPFDKAIAIMGTILIFVGFFFWAITALYRKQRKECPSCGLEVGADDISCAFCGYRLDEDEEIRVMWSYDDDLEDDDLSDLKEDIPAWDDEEYFGADEDKERLVEATLYDGIPVECSSCGTILDGGSDVCFVCGMPTDKVRTEHEEKDVLKIDLSMNEMLGMDRDAFECEECGALIDDNEEECPVCHVSHNQADWMNEYDDYIPEEHETDDVYSRDINGQEEYSDIDERKEALGMGKESYECRQCGSFIDEDDDECPVCHTRN